MRKLVLLLGIAVLMISSSCKKQKCGTCEEISQNQFGGNGWTNTQSSPVEDGKILCDEEFEIYNEDTEWRYKTYERFKYQCTRTVD
jgi:hypothetical protein